MWLTRVKATLFGIIGLYKKAVELALSVNDSDLAFKYANKPASSQAKKKLWMMITKRLVELKGQSDPTNELVR